MCVLDRLAKLRTKKILYGVWLQTRWPTLPSLSLSVHSLSVRLPSAILFVYIVCCVSLSQSFESRNRTLLVKFPSDETRIVYVGTGTAAQVLREEIHTPLKTLFEKAKQTKNKMLRSPKLQLSLNSIVRRYSSVDKPIGHANKTCVSKIFHEALTLDTLAKFRDDYYSDPKNVLSQNVCSRFNPLEVVINRKHAAQVSHVYNLKVELEGKPVTQQKSSGRCWLFAALNVLRLPFMKKHNLEEFEFSQGYLFFWDKIERTHYWLNNIVATARQGEALDSRLTAHLLRDPMNDGGQWDMLVNIINKYGLVPKKMFPESFSCTSSHQMNSLLVTKLREFAKQLREKVGAKASDAEIQSTINQQMKTIYNIIATCLGTPPQEFTFEFYNKSKEYHKIGPVSPFQFYQEHVKPLCNIDDKVCLVNDPRSAHPFGRLYTLQCLGNVVGGRPVAYNNQPIETLIKAVRDSIAGGEAVWFGCEVSKRFERTLGLEDLDAQDFKLVFNTEIQVGMEKADRLLYGDSCMTHAMVITAVGTDDKNEPTKFRVENSYGDDKYDKGYLLMTTQWFKEFVFEVVVDKKFVPKDVLAVFEQEPVVLPAWDPMGTLACDLCS